MSPFDEYVIMVLEPMSRQNIVYIERRRKQNKKNPRLVDNPYLS